MPVPIIGGLLGRFALSRVGKFFGRIPRWLWLTLAVAIVIGGSAWLHQRHANAKLEAAYSRGYEASNNKWEERFDLMQAEAEVWKKDYEEASAALTEERRLKHEEEVRHAAELADALRVSGPGRASAARCRPVLDPWISERPRPTEQQAPEPDAAGDPMLAADGEAIVPWPWLVTKAEEFDQLLSEVKAWRGWHTEQKELLDEKKRVMLESEQQ